MKRKWKLLSLLLLPFLVTGCFGPKQTSTQIDPPPRNAAQGMENAQSVGGKIQAKGAELYFVSDTGYVVPYTLNIPSVKGIAKEAMKFMVQGGPGESMLPKGFSCILPKGTKINGINLQNNTATIDFSKEFLTYDRKMEDKILNAVTWTLTSFENVGEVNIWVNGRPLEVMPKGKTAAQHLTRNRGINLEVLEGVNIAQSMPVTLYFLGQTSTNETYYVPVTRMVNRTSDVARAALRELVKGPAPTSNLVSALNSNTDINSVKVEGNTVMADLGDQLLEFNDQHAASKTAIDSIVFCLTGNTQAQKVKLTVNGKNSITVSGQKNKFDHPVSRPIMINPSGL